MRKIAALLLAAVMSVGLLTGCAEKNDSSSSTQSAANLTDEQLAEWEDVKEYKTGGITYRLPKSWKEIETEETSGYTEYRKFENDRFSVSVQFKKNYFDEQESIIESMYNGEWQFSLKEDHDIKVNDIDCKYLYAFVEDEQDITVKLLCYSKEGQLFFNFFDSDTDLLVEEMKKFSTTIKNNVECDPANAQTEESKDDYSKKVTVENVTFYVPSDSREEANENGIHTYYYTDWGSIMLRHLEDGAYIDYDDLGKSEKEEIKDNIVSDFEESEDYDFTVLKECWSSIDNHSIVYIELSMKKNEKTYYFVIAGLNSNVLVGIYSNKSLEDARIHYNEFCKYITIDEPTEKQRKSAETTTTTTETPKKTTTTTTTQETNSFTIGEENAIKQAQRYLDVLSFSRAGLYEQLTSEYGAGFSEQEASMAISYLEENGLVDWKEEAVEAAQSYMDSLSLSREGLYRQLTSEYGGQFTAEEAEYALAQIGY